MLCVTVTLGSNSEVGTLRVVILHRPGAELQRLTPRNNDKLLFDGLPWVARAQEEHDAFADLLRSRGVEVLLMSDLLTEATAQAMTQRGPKAQLVQWPGVGHAPTLTAPEHIDTVADFLLKPAA